MSHECFNHITPIHQTSCAKNVERMTLLTCVCVCVLIGYYCVFEWTREKPWNWWNLSNCGRQMKESKKIWLSVCESISVYCRSIAFDRQSQWWPQLYGQNRMWLDECVCFKKRKQSHWSVKVCERSGQTLALDQLKSISLSSSGQFWRHTKVNGREREAQWSG